MSGTEADRPSDRPTRIVLTGLTASGKTTVGRLVAERLGWPFVDTDAWIERRAGCSVADLFRERGEAAFRMLEREAVAACLDLPEAVIATGGGAVLDPASRVRMLARAFVVCLAAAPETVAARSTAEGLAKRPLLSMRDPVEGARLLLARRAPLYAQAHARVTTDDRPPGRVAEEIVRLWSRGRPCFRVAIAAEAGGGRPCEVWVGRGLLARAGERLAACLGSERPQPAARPAMLVSDETVFDLHGPACRAALEEAGFRATFAGVPPGEETKTLERAAGLYAAAAAAGLERGDPVVALGGGVVTDLAGFVAATYLRGVPWFGLPTTLLGQVDAAIGGKTGVNLPEGKNLVGAFHPPLGVICDTTLLATLPDGEWLSGLAECVKHGAIADLDYFAFLERDAGRLLARDPDAVEALVAGSVRIKAAIVSEDPREADRRSLLNFGHTVGHALEAVLEYRGIRHGEAVAVGMAVAADLSVELGLLAPAARDRLIDLLARLGLPTRIPGVPGEDLLAAASLDKKRRGGRLRWVLLAGLGEAVLHERVPGEAVRAALQRRGALPRVGKGS